MARQGGATFCAGGHWTALVIFPLGARFPVSFEDFRRINPKKVAEETTISVLLQLEA